MGWGGVWLVGRGWFGLVRLFGCVWLVGFVFIFFVWFGLVRLVGLVGFSRLFFVGVFVGVCVERKIVPRTPYVCGIIQQYVSEEARQPKRMPLSVLLAAC